MSPVAFPAAPIHFWLASLVVASSASLFAAEQAKKPWSKSERFEKAILAFETADKTRPSPPNAILFTGASNIVGWKTLAEDFPGLVVIIKP